MLVKSIRICTKYSLYNANGDWPCVVQAVSHALAGKYEKDHGKLVNNTHKWGQAGANKHKAIIQTLCQKAFKKKRYQSQKEAMRDGLSYQGYVYREAIEQLTKINDILLYLHG